MNELKKKLAAIEHERWADWQRHVHHQCAKVVVKNIDTGSRVIPERLVTKWDRQISTPYAALSEAEKQKDRDQVDRYWPLIEKHVAELKDINRGLCRDLDEAQRRIEELTGISI